MQNYEKQKSRLCTYGSVCEQEEQSIVYTFLIQSTSLQCEKTDLKLGLPLVWDVKLLYQVFVMLHNRKTKTKKQQQVSLDFTHSFTEKGRVGKINSANLLLKQFS